MIGWVKLHRKIIDWEWYDEGHTFKVWIHLILTANYKDNNWRGIIIKRGQRLCSLSILSQELKLSIRQIRTCLDRLKSTGELTIISTNRNSIITICKYESYQPNDYENDMPDDTQGDSQSTSNRHTIKSKKGNNSKEVNKYNRKNKWLWKFLESIKNDDMYIGSKWLTVKRNLKKTLTSEYLESIVDEVEDLSIAQLLDDFCRHWHESGNTRPQYGYDSMCKYFKKWVTTLSSRETKKRNSATESFLRGVHEKIESICKRNPAWTEAMSYELKSVYVKSGRPQVNDLLEVAKHLVDNGNEVSLKKLLDNWSFYEKKLKEWR